MAKRLITALITLLLAASGRAQFTITITSPLTGYPHEGDIVEYLVSYNNLPQPHKLQSAVSNGIILAENLEPSQPPAKLFIRVKWNCMVPAGSVSLTERISGVSFTFNTVILNFLTDPDNYCNTAVPAKQNLHYNQPPAPVSIQYCSNSCNAADNIYQYQWQVGDVPVGVFPQLPPSWANIPGAVSANYLPPAYHSDCIKAYRRITSFPGAPQQYYSSVAIISTFDYLQPGTISGGVLFNNGVPVITQTPATGGLCDGFNYVYTWERSTDNLSWQTIGTGIDYPANIPIPGPCFIRRRVDCGGETLYSNMLTVSPQPLLGGTLTGGGTYAYNTLPPVSQTAATGGVCNPNEYQYSWERSVDNGPWVTIGTGINYPATAVITASCRIRRKVFCIFETAYSNVLVFTMQPYISPNLENRNYIRTNEIQVPGIQSWEQADGLATGDKIQVTVYLDGWGRPQQQVIKQGSFKQAQPPLDPGNPANYLDLVTITGYDGLDRPDKSYLPYASATANGFYKNNAVAEQQQFINQKYNEPPGSIYTYASTTYEASPVSRIMYKKLPGAAWNTNPAYKGISEDFEIGSAQEKIHSWNIGYAHGDKPVDAGIYADGQLLKNITRDENGLMTIEYKDRTGNLILKKEQKETGTGFDPNGYAGWVSTYYVYDDFGHLRCVITPKCVEQLVAAGSWVITDNMQKGLCFYFEYDQRGRMVVKHSPDAAEIWMVYDNRDRLVFSQDANQRGRAGLIPPLPVQWSYSLYDDQDRVLVTGLINDNRNRDQLQAMVDALNNGTRPVEIYAGTWETLLAYNPVAGRISNGGGYYCQTCTAVFTNTVNYYDDYGHRPAGHSFVEMTAADFAPAADPNPEQLIQSRRVKGLLTIARARILGPASETENPGEEKFLSSTYYIDEKGQMLQVHADNIKSATDIAAMQYNFAGKILSSRILHKAANSVFNNLYEINRYEYDLLGRKRMLRKLYTKQAADISDLAKYKKLSGFVYDDQGRVLSRDIGEDPQLAGKPMEIQEFTYNIQGWLTGINKNYALALNTPGTPMQSQWARHFGLYLGYENSDGKFLNPQWNGNITGAVWRSQGDNSCRKFNYEYDNLNRFMAARFLQKDDPLAGDNTYSNNMVDLTVLMTGYDANGNILGMKQTGIIPGTNGGVLIDDLTYQYDVTGNRLKAVNDLAFGGNNLQNGRQGDFRNYVPSTGQDYDYDDNGNLKNDRNKNIVSPGSSGIISNLLDLPRQIIINNKSKTEFTYDAAGHKLARKLTLLAPGSPAPRTTFYCGTLVFEEDSLRYILHEEGKIRIMDPVTGWSGPSGQVNYVTIRGNIEFANTGTGGNGNKWGVWDYNIKDQHSNTRMVLTGEYHQQQLHCSMEASPTVVKDEEEATFGNTTANELAATRISTASLPWQPSPYVSKLIFVAPGVSPATTVGPNVILKVMAGDYIDAMVKFYYRVNGTSNNNNPGLISNIANSLFGFLQHPGQVSGVIKDNISVPFLSSNAGPLIPFITANNPSPANSVVPRAFLNYIFFDEQFRYVRESSGAIALPAPAANQVSVEGTLQCLQKKAVRNGYVYIYLSNESSNIPVYFDDFHVSHTRGALLEDNAYYPFGLKIQGISARAALKPATRQGYQGSFAETDEETAYDEFSLRSYDPQLGRWIEPDPKDAAPGPYTGMGNNPLSYVDPDGGDVRDWVKYITDKGHVAVQWFSKAVDQATAEEEVRKIGGTQAEYVGKTGTWTSNVNGIQYWLLMANGKALNITSIINAGTLQDTHPYIEPGEIRPYEPHSNFAGHWEDFNKEASYYFGNTDMVIQTSKVLYGSLDMIWTAASTIKNGWRGARNMRGDNLLSTYGGLGAFKYRWGAAVSTLSLPLGALEGGTVEESFIYRWDTRAPERIREAGGFWARGNNMDLYEHMNGTSIGEGGSGYVATSLTEKGAIDFAAGRQGYMYKIQFQRGFNVNFHLGELSQFKFETELAVPHHIPFYSIIDYWPINMR